MKVYLFTLLVRRSMYTEVPVTVPRHEADLLRAVHSGDVDLLEDEPVGFFEVGAVYEERDRLRMFQLAAARRRLNRFANMLRQAKAVSTRSRPKAADYGRV